MLTAIRDFFDRNIAGGESPADERHRTQIAVAALLLEVVRLDGGVDEAERAAVLRAVRSKFGLTDGEAAALVALAEAEAQDATDYYQFTSLINRHFSAEQRERAVEMMWEVAYADADLSANEQHVLRRVADLLYVPHSRYIAAKLRARDAAGD
jgi:uncharacterized tellurite resistance protein B-like protein